MVKRNVRILHCNLRSCYQNFNSFRSYLHGLSFQYDIIVITETWLCDAINDLFELSGYNHISLHRSRYGGGIRVYYLHDIIVNVYNEFTGLFETHEALFLRVTIKEKLSCVLGCVYRPPSKSITHFNEYLNLSLLSNEFIQKNKCILIGDFNVDYFKRSAINNYQLFFDAMHEGGFNLLIDEPTHYHAHHPNSLIDHIWVNFNKCVHAEVIQNLISDHLPVVLNIKLPDKKSVILKKYFRDLSALNFENFDLNKNEIFNAYEIVGADPNVEMNRFVKWLEGIIDIYFPLKMQNMSAKRMNMPWIDDETMDFINKKHKLFLAYKKGLVAYSYFNDYCKVLKLLLKRLEISYFKHRFLRCKKDSKKTWETINDVLGRVKKDHVYAIKCDDGNITSDPLELSNLFNKYFHSVPHETQKKLKQPLCNYDYLVPSNPHSIFLVRATQSEISSIIAGLDNKKSSINLPLKFLKYAKEEISLILSNLFNLCLSAGVYPDALKIARVVPLFKSGNSCNLSNYRPISILPSINKIFEKLLFNRLDDFFLKL